MTTRLPAMSRAVSPMMEMGAYEYLWTMPGQTFNRLADKFKIGDRLPSDFVDAPVAEEYAHKTTEILRDGAVDRFGLRIKGTGDYPERLQEAHPLELLYFQGCWELIETKCIAVVGTRNPTPDGLARTRKIVRALVKDGFTIVSGLAAGIDRAAHTTAIEEGGLTIGVIGTPLSQSYPRENVELQRRIATEYLLISQVPVIRHSQQDWRQNRAFFPQRNITMSALTSGTVIVEASDTSGTLMQAKAALKQGRKLFILDSCFQNSSLEWPRKYEAEGAIRVRTYADIQAHLVEPPQN